MQLSTLIGHSSQLLRFIMKAYSPPDKILYDYFREKKYLGASDRRFIAETLFLSLRLLKLSEHCLYHTFESLNKKYDSMFVEIISKNDGYFKGIIISSLIISYLYNSNHQFFNTINKLSFPFAHLLRIPELNKMLLIQNQEPNNEITDFLKYFSSEISKNFNINELICSDLVNEIINSFHSLDRFCKELLNENKTIDKNNLNYFSKRYSMPEIILESWINNSFNSFSHLELLNLAEYFLVNAPICLRVNLSKFDLQDVTNELNDKKIPYSPGKYSSACIKLNKRIQLNEYKFYRTGVAEVQDEASQLVALALAPESNARILDACAGAGGKSLHIADIQKDNGTIIAIDIEPKRLHELSKRAKKAQFHSIKTFLIKHNNWAKSDYFKNPFDAVLIDAPCSGTGTARRTPTHKWKLDYKLLERLIKKQKKLLEDYSEFVKPGGVLVYSTCSLLPEENEFVIGDFLKNHKNFTGDSLHNAFKKMNINTGDIVINDYMTYITPLNDNCDGFFISRLKRIV